MQYFCNHLAAHEHISCLRDETVAHCFSKVQFIFSRSRLAKLALAGLLLSTHADRQGVDISFTVCLFVCTVTDFSGEDKASGVKFCTVIHGRPGQGISHFGSFAPS